MGETNNTTFPLTFNRSIKIESRPEKLSANAGAELLRELDDRFDYTRFLSSKLRDSRRQDLITHPLNEMLRTRLYLIAMGLPDQDDADYFRHDPSFRLAVSERKGDAPLRIPDDEQTPDGLSSQPTQSRFIKMLSTDSNKKILREGLIQTVGAGIRATRGHRHQNATLDIDFFPVTVYGEQAGSTYSGYYRSRAYNVLACMLSETSDFIDMKLFPGTTPPVNEVAEIVLPLVTWMEKEVCVTASVRGDAGMPAEELLGPLDDHGNGYCFRIKTNSVLDDIAKPYVGRLEKRKGINYEDYTFHELEYKAETWSRKRRTVLVVKRNPGELFADWFFLITNWSEGQMPPGELLDFYRKRGIAENHFGELKSDVLNGLPCTQRAKSRYQLNEIKNPSPVRTDDEVFEANETTLLLFGYGYNLLNRTRHIAQKAMPIDRGPSASPRWGGWSIRRTRDRLLRVAARFSLHARRVTMIIGEASALLWNKVAPYFASTPFVTITDTT